MKYGQRLKAARLHKGWTQPDLERATDGQVKQGSISKIERGDQGISAFDIPLAYFLDVNAKWLYDGDERYKPSWLNNTENTINEQQGDYWHSFYKTRPLKPIEVELLTAFDTMTPEQQETLLATAKNTANQNLVIHAHVNKTKGNT